MLGPLVVGGEASRVGRLGDLALEDLLEGVGTLARGVDVAHQMHDDRDKSLSISESLEGECDKLH